MCCQRHCFTFLSRSAEGRNQIANPCIVKVMPWADFWNGHAHSLSAIADSRNWRQMLATASTHFRNGHCKLSMASTDLRIGHCKLAMVSTDLRIGHCKLAMASTHFRIGCRKRSAAMIGLGLGHPVLEALMKHPARLGKWKELGKTQRGPPHARNAAEFLDSRSGDKTATSRGGKNATSPSCLPQAYLKSTRTWFFSSVVPSLKASWARALL